jgi:HPt (histidine-containing phosphotransfer) domain-containing protein
MWARVTAEPDSGGKPGSILGIFAMGTNEPSPLASRADEDGAVDLSILRAQTGGDAELEREVLGLFLTRANGELARLKAAATADERRKVAHGLVGAAGAVGAVKVARLAASVERGNAVALPALEAAIAEAGRLITRHLAQ